MKVENMCSRRVATIHAGEPLLSAARTMREEHVGCVVVVEDRAGRAQPVGVITDRDIAVAVVARGIDQLSSLDARDVLAREVVACKEGDDVAGALERMLQHGVRRLPVVDARGALVGILSTDDVIGEFAQALMTISQIVAEQQRDERRRRL
jgi:CBS domain-containing protein